MLFCNCNWSDYPRIPKNHDRFSGQHSGGSDPELSPPAGHVVEGVLGLIGVFRLDGLIGEQHAPAARTKNQIHARPRRTTNQMGAKA